MGLKYKNFKLRCNSSIKNDTQHLFPQQKGKKLQNSIFYRTNLHTVLLQNTHTHTQTYTLLLTHLLAPPLYLSLSLTVFLLSDTKIQNWHFELFTCNSVFTAAGDSRRASLWWYSCVFMVILPDPSLGNKHCVCVFNVIPDNISLSVSAAELVWLSADGNGGREWSGDCPLVNRSQMPSFWLQICFFFK